MDFSMDPEGFFDYQRQLWQNSEAPAALGISPKKFAEEYIEPLREQLRRFKTAPWRFNDENLPFVIVMPERIVSLILQLRAIQLGKHRGGTDLNLGRLRDIVPLFCAHRPFLAMDVTIREERGAAIFSHHLDPFRPVMVEVLAAAMVCPDLLREHRLILHGTRYESANQETVPFLIRNLRTMGPKLVKGVCDQHTLPSDESCLAVLVTSRT